MAREEYDFQIIANFLAGDGSARKLLARLTAFLKERQQTFRILKIEKPTPISQLPFNGAKIRKGVICLGGDGTVSETVGYSLNRSLNVPIALLPTGTANIIAATLGLEPKKADFDFLLEGREKKVDIGVVDYEAERHFFILGLGLGFEEKFLKLTKEKLKKKMGIFSYIFAALSELLSLRKIPIEIESEGEKRKLEVCLLTALNMKPRILKLFPLFEHEEIKLDDGYFNLYYVEHRHFFQAFLGTLVFHLLGQKHFGLVKSLRVKEFSLISPQACSTQVDGEIRPCLPARIYFHSTQARFLIP
jgi:diacylglycerol kinase (ATP)